MPTILKILDSRRSRRDLLLLSLILTALLWQPHFLHQEINLFEWGLYLPGIDAVSHGQVPYRDVFYLRGPFELYAQALFMKAFGFRADVLAVYFYIGTIVTLLLALWIAWELIDSRALLYSLMLILMTRTFPRVVFTFWGGMRYAWGLLALGCLVRFFKHKHPAWLFAAGIISAVAAATSIEIGILSLMACVCAILAAGQWRRLWLPAAGFLIVLVPYGAYLASQHALAAFLQAQWMVVTRMQATFPQIGPVPDTLVKFVQGIFFPLDKNFYHLTPMYTFMFFVPWYLWRLKQGRLSDLDHAAMAVGVYALLLFLTSLRNFWACEYEMSLQPQKIILFYLWGKGIAWAGGRQKYLPLLLIAAVIISSSIYAIGRFKTRFYNVSWIGQIFHKDASGMINGSPSAAIDLPRLKHTVIPVWQKQDLQQLRDFFGTHTSATEVVWTYPELGSLNFFIQRPWPGRFPMATLAWMNEEWFNEYIATIQKHWPRYAVVNRQLPDYFETSYFQVAANRAKYESTMRLLKEHYRPAAQTPTYVIYQRID